MFPKVQNTGIQTQVADYEISPNVIIHVKTLRGPSCSGRKAIYIHGGGGGGNHTLVERPSRWLIEQGLFDEIILPDRRGDGGSSPLQRKLSVREQAEDMRLLLDAMHVHGPLVALGVSYGGPIALELAYLDPRMEQVILMASSPSLLQTSGLTTLLLKTGLLRRLMRIIYQRNVGQLAPQYTDFDPGYDCKNPNQMASLYFEALKHTEPARLDSLLYELESTLDPRFSNVAADVTLNIPILQIIGERDEIWGTRLLPEDACRFPKWKHVEVRGARIHKDVFLKASLYYKALAEALRREDRQRARASGRTAGVALQRQSLTMDFPS